MTVDVLIPLMALMNGVILLWVPWVSKQIIDLKVSIAGLREQTERNSRDIVELQKLAPRQLVEV